MLSSEISHSKHDNEGWFILSFAHFQIPIANGLPASPSAVSIDKVHRNKFTTSIYYVVAKKELFALRQILLVAIFTVVTLLGGVCFYYSEKGYEKKMIRDYVATMTTDMDMWSAQFEQLRASGDQAAMKTFLKEKYKALLEVESRYTRSVLWKSEDGNYAWQFWPAVFFSTNVFMAVDYGTVPNQNGISRIITVIYGWFTIPLAIVVVRDFGQFYLFLITKAYAAITRLFRRIFHLAEPMTIELPFYASFVCLLVSWVVCAGFICGYDARFGDDSINYWYSFYLAYLTVTTIGIGDIMPTYTYKAPLWKFFCFFVGTPFRTVNHSTFAIFEKSWFLPLNKASTLMANALGRRVAPAPGLPQFDAFEKPIQEYITDGEDLYGGDYGRVRINADAVQDS